MVISQHLEMLTFWLCDPVFWCDKGHRCLPQTGFGPQKPCQVFLHSPLPLLRPPCLFKLRSDFLKNKKIKSKERGTFKKKKPSSSIMTISFISLFHSGKQTGGAGVRDSWRNTWGYYRKTENTLSWRRWWKIEVIKVKKKKRKRWQRGIKTPIISVSAQRLLLQELSLARTLNMCAPHVCVRVCADPWRSRQVSC